MSRRKLSTGATTSTSKIEKRKLIFGPDVPDWIKRAVRRERKRMNLEEWTITVDMYSEEEAHAAIGDRVEWAAAYSQSDPRYRQTKIYFPQWAKNDELFTRYLRHELCHARLSVTFLPLDTGLTAKPRLTRDQLFSLLENEEEALIEWIVGLLD